MNEICVRSNGVVILTGATRITQIKNRPSDGLFAGSHTWAGLGFNPSVCGEKLEIMDRHTANIFS